MMLEVRDLVKKYPDFKLNCSFTVAEGQVVGFVGRNGVGKSTTFKALLDLIPIDSGVITIFGKAHNELSSRERMRLATTFPDSYFSEELTVRDIQKILRGFYQEAFDSEFFERSCEQLSLPTEQKIKEFSTGMKAKLKLLSALVHDADLLLLDEPTAGLDVIVRKELLDLLQDYLDEKKERSILISSHISSDLEQLCDRIILIDDGQIVLQEDTDVLLNEYGILKLSTEDWAAIDQRFILATKPRSYGLDCLTNQKAFYRENYPKAVIENGSLDEVLLLLAKEAK